MNLIKNYTIRLTEDEHKMKVHLSVIDLCVQLEIWSCRCVREVINLTATLTKLVMFPILMELISCDNSFCSAEVGGHWQLAVHSSVREAGWMGRVAMATSTLLGC